MCKSFYLVPSVSIASVDTRRGFYLMHTYICGEKVGLLMTWTLLAAQKKRPQLSRKAAMSLAADPAALS